MNEFEKYYEICPCSLKYCYSYKDARTLINWCKSKHMKGKKKIPVREYFCPDCNKYHVTSKKLVTY